MEKIQLPPNIDASWHPYLTHLFEDQKMNMLKDKVIPRTSFYPASKDIFRVFEMPISAIKVVILGQDPYPNGEANGLAFAVNSGFSIPKSLNIIRAEIANSIKDLGHSDTEWKTLEHWKKQGVFLLNAALTVEAKNAGSHMGYWQWFTREVVTTISKVNPCVWMLWGGKAQAFESYINNEWVIANGENSLEGWVPDKKGNNFVLKAYHPAAEAYDPNRKEKFSGCGHFKTANEVLKLIGQEPINW